MIPLFYICGQDLWTSSIEVLEPIANNLFNWFQQNGQMAKPLFNQPVWKNFHENT